MYVRQADRDLNHLCKQNQQRLAKLKFEAKSARLVAEGIELFRDAEQRLSRVLTAVDREAVEASEAREDLLEAVELLQASFNDLYDGAVIARNLQRLGSGSRQLTHLPDVARYLDGHTPSTFAERARSDKLAIMSKAVDYAERYLADSPVPDEVIAEAVHALDRYTTELEALENEEGDLLTVRNEADHIRSIAHREYIAGRKVVEAALSLADSPQPIHELVPSLSSILRGNPSADADADQPAEPAEPAEPVEPADA